MSTLSVIVLTKNSERLLEKCLQSVEWAEEIIVLDSGSDDRTEEIAKRFTEGFYAVQWRGFSATRNKGIEMARGDWILVLDSDEVLEQGSAEEIKGIVAGAGNADGYYIRRRAYFLDKRIRFCGWGRDRQLRLFKKGKGQLDEKRKVHEGVVLDGQTGTLKARIDHYSYPTIEGYLRRMNVYTSLWAEERHESGVRGGALAALFRGPWTFFEMYVLKLGFLDGFTGLVLCVLSSVSTFSRYLKLWELGRK